MQVLQVVLLIIIAAVMFGVIGFIILLANYYTLNGIRAKTIGDGQHGTAKVCNQYEFCDNRY